MNPTERFVVEKGRYVEQAPDLEYCPTATTLAQAIERELDAKPWAAGTVRGTIAIAVDGEKSIEALERERIDALVARGRPAPFGRGETTVYDEAIRRCTQIEGERVAVTGAGWDAACEAIRCGLAAEMGLAGCDIEIEVHKLLLYRAGDHFATHADTEKSEGMVASAVVITPESHAGGALVAELGEARARLADGAAPPGYARWAVWYADVAHRVEPVREGARVAIALNVRLGAKRALEARPIRDARLARSLWTRTYEDHHTAWAERQGIEGTGGRQYARKLVWLLAHRYTEPGLRGELLKGADRQLAALLGTKRGSERVLLGWLEARTVGYAAPMRGWRWNDNDPLWGERRAVDHAQAADEEEEDRAGLALEIEDEEWDSWPGMLRVEPPEGLPVLSMGRVRRRDVWVEGLRTLDGERPGYGRIAVEACELAPAEATAKLATCGARVYEATGNEGAILELQYRHAALVVWQPNESALDMLAESGGRAALAGELATTRRLGHGESFHARLDDVAERWTRAMAADGGGPAPQAHRTLLGALSEGERDLYAQTIALRDLDEAGARMTAWALRAADERTLKDWLEWYEALERQSASWRRRGHGRTNRSGEAALLEQLLTDEAGAAIAERICGGAGAEAIAERIAARRRETDRSTYERRRQARITRDYEGDGLRE